MPNLHHEPKEGKMDKAQEIIEIMTLVNALAPPGISLVKQLATQLQGKTDAEILAEADAIDEQTIATADAEIKKLDDAANPPQG
jgi:hypothetical protein